MCERLNRDHELNMNLTMGLFEQLYDQFLEFSNLTPAQQYLRLLDRYHRITGILNATITQKRDFIIHRDTRNEKFTISSSKVDLLDKTYYLCSLIRCEMKTLNSSTIKDIVSVTKS